MPFLSHSGAPSTGLSPLSQLPQAHTDPRKDADLAEKAGAGRLSVSPRATQRGLHGDTLAPGSELPPFQAVSSADRSPERNLGELGCLHMWRGRPGSVRSPANRGPRRPASGPRTPHALWRNTLSAGDGHPWIKDSDFDLGSGQEATSLGFILCRHGPLRCRMEGEWGDGQMADIWPRRVYVGWEKQTC